VTNNLNNIMTYSASKSKFKTYPKDVQDELKYAFHPIHDKISFCRPHLKSNLQCDLLEMWMRLLPHVTVDQWKGRANGLEKYGLTLGILFINASFLIVIRFFIGIRSKR
jgi:hypothetical protein